MTHRSLGLLCTAMCLLTLVGCDLSKEHPSDVQKTLKSRPADTVQSSQAKDTIRPKKSVFSNRPKKTMGARQKTPPSKVPSQHSLNRQQSRAETIKTGRADPVSQLRTQTNAGQPGRTRTVKAAPRTAPKQFKVKIETTKGVAYMDVYRDWAPKGADRFYQLVTSGYYTDIAFYRVIEGFIAQFGLHGNPKVAQRWKRAFFTDEKIKVSNSRGFVSFAASGPNSRTTQLFINLKNNRHLDKSDGVPIGRIDKASMKVIDQLYSGYGKNGTATPNYEQIENKGNAYLRSTFPQLDYVQRMTVVPASSQATEMKNPGRGESSTKTANQRLRKQSRSARRVNLMQGPKAQQLKAPDAFRVLFETTQGAFIVNVYRSWAPQGVDRFYNLVKLGFFTEVAFFRVIPNFMAQFGISGNPQISKAWKTGNLKDDTVKKTNARGTLTFATAGPNSRTTQMFINFKDNAFLDQKGFSPVGFIDENGMKVVDRLYSGYGEGAPQGTGPRQSSINAEGNAYLKGAFPKLDYIQRAHVLP